MTILELMKSTMFAGIGMQEKAKDFFDELVKQGTKSDSQEAKAIKEWTEKADKSSLDLQQTISDFISKALNTMNLPTKDDLDKINKKIDALSSKIKDIDQKK